MKNAKLDKVIQKIKLNLLYCLPTTENENKLGLRRKIAIVYSLALQP